VVPVLDEREREALVEADSQLSALQDALEAAAHSDALDREVFERLRVTAREAIHRLNQNLPPQLDPDARDEIRRRLIDMLTLPTEGMSLLDIADRALLEAEAVRHVVRDVLQEQPPAEVRDARDVVTLVEQWLPDLTVRQVAELLGMSERQVQRRRHEGGPSTHRMQLVARLVAILRHAWTDQGVYAWFKRPRVELDGQAPLAILDDAGAERQLMLAARAGRVQGGS
jgi:AraC-like DNA-binding protein